MCPNTLAAGITAIAAAIAEGREADEITLIGATLTQLGDTLATIAAQKNFCGKQALGQKGDLVVSRVMRKLVCSQKQKEVNRQKRHRHTPRLNASCSYTSCCPTENRRHGAARNI